MSFHFFLSGELFFSPLYDSRWVMGFMIQDSSCGTEGLHSLSADITWLLPFSEKYHCFNDDSENDAPSWSAALLCLKYVSEQLLWWF